jgi:hypothetical protein
MKKKTVSAYDRFRNVLGILFVGFIIFTAVMVLIIKDTAKCIIIVGIVGGILFLVSLLMSLLIVAGEYDKRSIKILNLSFEKIDDGMNKLMEASPDIFVKCSYINTFVFNTYDNHYYEIYAKDDIKWMRDIGVENPIERLYYGY